MKKLKLDIQRFATPKTGTRTKIYMSDEQYPEEKDLTLVMYTEEIPSPEEPAEAVTYQTTDMDGEEQAKGSKKANTISIPVYYKREQHQSIKAIADSDVSKWFFIRYPEATCEDGEEPLVKSFSAQMDLTGDTITVDDIIHDILTLYRNSAVKESYGLPKAPSESENSGD